MLILFYAKYIEGVLCAEKLPLYHKILIFDATPIQVQGKLNIYVDHSKNQTPRHRTSTISIGQINSSRLAFKTFKEEIENFVLEVTESTAPGPFSQLVHTVIPM